MKARITRVYREVFRTPSIPGTRDISAVARIEVVRYEPINNANNPTVYVELASFGFVQHGDGIDWESIEFTNDENARIYRYENNECGAIKDAQKRLAGIVQFLQATIDAHIAKTEAK